MRKPFMAANWKCFKKKQDTIDFLNAFNGKVNYDERDAALFPTFTTIETLNNNKDERIITGAQDCSPWERQGAYTGEVSASMLKDIGCEYVIIGHSERRKYFNEHNEIVNRKIKAAINNGLSVILCIGESYEEREREETFEVLGIQLKSALEGILAIDKVIIAYEPIWAIGTGKTATGEMIEEVHRWIRDKIRERYSEAADNIRIIYGGSVKPDNVSQIMQIEDVDGVLVGGAALDAESFLKIVNF